MTEKPIPLKEALPLLGGITRQTAVRWATEGLNGRQLGAYKIGAHWYITLEAIERFKHRPEVHAPEFDHGGASRASEYLSQEYGI